MTIWEKTTREAQTAFAHNAYRRAIELNQKALIQAQAQFDSQFTAQADKAVACVQVSYFNLIDTHLAIQDIHYVYHLFDQSYCFLKNKLSMQLTDSQVMAIIRGLQHLKIEWINFVNCFSNSLTGAIVHQAANFEHRIDNLLNKSDCRH